MPRRISVVLLFAAFLVPSVPAPTHAQLRRGGMDLRLFRPSVDSKGLIGVDGTDVLGAQDVSFGLVLDAGFGLAPFDGFVNDPSTPAEGAEREDHLLDQLFSGTLQASYGIANVAAVGVRVPVLVASGPDVTVPGAWNDGAFPQGLDHQGLGDLVLHGKLRLTRVERQPVGLAVIGRVGLPTGDAAALAGEPGPWLWPSVVLEWRPARPLRIAAEAGYRLVLGTGGTLRLGGRTVPGGGNATGAELDPGASGDTVSWGDVITFGAGASLRVLDPVDLVVELSGHQIADAMGQPRALSTEARAGLKVFVERDSYLTLAAGLGLGDGIATPEVRGVVGFVFEPSIGDRDGDGLRDDVDRCPAEPEDWDGFVDDDGCPDPDDDRDGLLDVDDECPRVPEDRDGDADDDGCPEGDAGDRDGDGLLDAVDECPDDPEDRDGFQDEDGCPDPDNDGDGLLDADDLCPDRPEDADGFEDGDGCPDPDNDEDRILDADDTCPDEPENYNGHLDEDGCDDHGDLEVEEGGFVLFKKIQFETDSARILPESFPLLDSIAGALHGHPEILLAEIQGHADERASDEYNLRLTRDRAHAVMMALRDRGVAAERMRAAGYGERCPLDPRHNARAWERNRRVEIVTLRTTEGPTHATPSCRMRPAHFSP